ncbi:LysR family transcriptional regulator [Pseudogemmobacter humi]|uniref:HTH-type transcriptional regulator CynR n=1 Tax=Pseudogemmobacter humi TaxID=2483812 RepID=A0A3P5XFQ3_9RHOB|nr:LysR family transcriptional regulator [Pseudogemmobacter humi]VDC33580.1 HTH-type transcriptional regulator CynR [Pseudogemmobacter humi]
MVRFTLRQCAYFRAVAEHGGIAQAARILNISQPSVAQAIEKLEHMTGLMLFDRHHARGLSLTLQGRMFLKHVEGLLQQAEQVEREAAALAAERAGEIRLGVFWTLSPFYAAGLIRSFHTILPGIVVRHQEMSLVSLADTLRDGTIDFALTYERGAELSDMALIELAAPKPMVVLAADHPLAARESVNLHDLADEPYVLLDGPGSRSYFVELLAEGGITPQISYVSTSMEAVRSAVASGFGFTLLVMQPPSNLTYDRREIRALRIENDIRPLRIVLASRDGMHRGPITRRFTDHAISYFAALGEGGR